MQIFMRLHRPQLVSPNVTVISLRYCALPAAPQGNTGRQNELSPPEGNTNHSVGSLPL